MNTKPNGDNDPFLFATEESNNPETQFEKTGFSSEKAESKLKPVPFYYIFRFCDGTDVALLLLGVLAAVIVGGTGPLFNLLFGTMSDEFTKGKDAILDAVSRIALYQFLIGIAVFIFGAISQMCWMVSGERQTLKYRAACLRSLLTQNMGWYDRMNQNELTSKIELDIAKIHEAIGEKISNFIMTIMKFLSGFAIGFTKGWQLSLIVLASIPAVIVIAVFYIFILQNITKKSAEAYKKAGAKAEQTFIGIKTVKMLNGEVIYLGG